MQFADYTEFRTHVQILVENNEPNTDNLLALDTMIALGEGIVHYGGTVAGDGRYLGPLRASSMQADLDGVAADNAFSLPDDCMELVTVWVDGGAPLEVVAEADLRTRLPWIGGGNARKCAQAGDSIVFSPSVADGTAVGGRYYAKPPALKDELHSTFLRYPELYLYASLLASAPSYGQEERIPVWSGYYTQLLDQANRQERMRVKAGGRLRQVAR